MASELIVTHEIAAAPKRRAEAHKRAAGRNRRSSGRCVVGAPSLAANAAFRSGAGLVQVLVPEAIRTSVAVLAPCATIRRLPTDAAGLLQAATDFHADVVAPG